LLSPANWRRVLIAFLLDLEIIVLTGLLVWRVLPEWVAYMCQFAWSHGAIPG